MKTQKFPGWDRIDGSAVTEEEIDAAFQAVMARSRKIEVSRTWHRPQQRRPWGRWIVVAAAVATLLAVPYAAWRYVQDHEPDPVALTYTQFSTSRGEIAEVVLPDQSKVVLNAESVLIYPEQFGAERSVYLSGEAIFDVTASAEHPFYVRTSDVTVKVHGTRFNVSAWFDEDAVSTTLCRGVITAWPNGAEGQAVTLVPNQNYTYDRATGTAAVTQANALEAVAWESGELCFRSASIHSLIRQVERRYDVNVFLTGAQYDQAVITAKFIHGETLDELMDAVCMIVPGMTYVRDGNAIYLK